MSVGYLVVKRGSKVGLIYEYWYFIERARARGAFIDTYALVIEPIDASIKNLYMNIRICDEKQKTDRCDKCE